MKRITLIVNGVCLAGLLVLASTFAQQQQNQLVRSSAVFEGKTRLRDARTKGELRDVDVKIQNVAIVGGQKLESFGLRSDAIRIVQLRGGELITIIGGKRQERQEGEFWTVPAGVSMAVETQDDTASIQVFEISKP
jgi:quercetin dioxygenase-like cupin family protein